MERKCWQGRCWHGQESLGVKQSSSKDAEPTGQLKHSLPLQLGDFHGGESLELRAEVMTVTPLPLKSRDFRSKELGGNLFSISCLKTRRELCWATVSVQRPSLAFKSSTLLTCATFHGLGPCRCLWVTTNTRNKCYLVAFTIFSQSKQKHAGNVVSFRVFELHHPLLKDLLESTFKKIKAKRAGLHVILRELTVMTLEFHNSPKLEPTIWRKYWGYLVFAFGGHLWFTFLHYHA